MVTRMCFQLRVIRAFPEEKTIWSEEYKVAKSQIQNLYNRITKQIAEEVKIELTPSEEALLAESRTVDPDAWDAYMKGLFYWEKLDAESMQKSLEVFPAGYLFRPRMGRSLCRPGKCLGHIWFI